MRTLATAALREQDCGIPKPWLETVKRKAASYSKFNALFISDYKKANNIGNDVVLSVRENKILQDLYKGFSRSEIAVNQNLSINTVKLVINNIYEKLSSKNIADVIRTVAERKLV